MDVDRLKKYIVEILTLYKTCNEDYKKFHYIIELIAIRRTCDCFNIFVWYDIEDNEIYDFGLYDTINKKEL